MDSNGWVVELVELVVLEYKQLVVVLVVVGAFPQHDSYFNVTDKAELMQNIVY